MIKRTLIALTAVLLPLASQAFDGLGRNATPNEVKAWDIDVRPDFQGLPPGKGSVKDGEKLWIDKCASCHGDFGDAGHVYFPLIGNTTKDDIKTGRVAALKDSGKGRTTMTKVPTVSTLYDFIYRAMPWNAPKSLTPDEVYALVAYMVNLAEIVPDDYVLSDQNIAEVQARMPNRNGMVTNHGMWSVKGKPDVVGIDCSKNCAKSVAITSKLPEYAYDAHGDLSQQTRSYGPVRGWKVGMSTKPAAEEAKGPAAPSELLTGKGCMSCHGMDHGVVGPGFAEVRKKYAGKADAPAHLLKKIRAGGGGVWGQIPMPPQPTLSEADTKTIVDWLTAK